MRALRKSRFVLVAVTAASLAACSGSEDVDNGTPQKVSSDQGSAFTTSILARVDGTPITELELEQAMDRLFANHLEPASKNKIRQQVLQSLISSRAISRLAEREQDAADQRALAVKVSSYREELLVKAYLQAHATPEPISTEMVEAYYASHTDEFGGTTRCGFELIQTNRELKEEERSTLIKLLGGLSSEQDWQQWVNNHSTLPIAWRQLSANTEILKQPLKSLVSSTAAGSVSPLHVTDQLIIVKVRDRTELPPKPLQEVSAEIRRKLAPLKMKEAIKEISDAASKQLTIEILAPAAGSSAQG